MIFFYLWKFTVKTAKSCQHRLTIKNAISFRLSRSGPVL